MLEMKTVGQRLQRARIAACKTREEAAAESDMSVKRLELMEQGISGGNPREDPFLMDESFFKLCMVLSVTLDDLVMCQENLAEICSNICKEIHRGNLEYEVNAIENQVSKWESAFREQRGKRRI